ncbi:MAG TPA: DEAD/DEAH box helicase, partial [Bacteroidia bacterium]|nr:DEAD/DEAH box helicase [Bacteroidia bacterium]
MNNEQGFTQFKLNKQIFNAIAETGFTEPTAIQRKAITPILAGQEVIGIAQTGTGKTAAYLLPLIKMLGYAQGVHPRALIVIPTRELAQQVANNFTLFAKYTDLRCTVAIGATGSKKQIEAIEAGIDILIATPGRLLELYSEGHLILKKIEYFVLDEAERLMDISFMRQLYALLEVLPRKRKHYLFSATMSDLVKKIAADFVAFPTVIEIEPEQKTAKTITQLAYALPNLKTKLNLLTYLLKQTTEVGVIIKKLIVFCRSKETANNLYKYFTRINGADYATVVHGNKAQQSRLNAVNNFTHQAITMLIAT